MDALPHEDGAPFRQAVFVGPHLDDAVLACGRLLDALPGAIVVTVFAGRPAPGTRLTDWDAAGGFAAGDDVVGLRREEDRAALAVLGAEPLWLDFVDAQYGPSPDAADIARSLRAVCRERPPDALFFPLGLFHSDHRLTRQAVLQLLPEFPACRWFAYGDALYRTLPGEVDAALAALRSQGFSPRPARFGERADAASRKHAAVERYVSQLRALRKPGRLGLAGLDDAESYWQLSPLRGGSA